MATQSNVPNGITFGTKVLTIPGIGFGLTHSGGIENRLASGSYGWVTRGDPIAEFVIHGSAARGGISRMLSNKRHAATIRAPASGLVLHTGIGDELSLNEWNAMKHPPMARFAMLLPDDEPRTEDGKYLFGETCRLIQSMSHYYFKNSRRGSSGPISQTSLSNLLDSQLGVSPLIFDALPFWADYLDEARTNRPDLRPYLKHLQTE